jgi:hypothetical protein
MADPTQAAAPADLALEPPASAFDPAEVMRKKVAEMLNGGTISAINMIPITVALMQLAERPRWGLGGLDKKQLVMRVLRRYVDEVEDVDLRVSLHVLLQATVPDMIDALASVASGETVIKGGCFRRLIELCCGAADPKKPSQPSAPAAE